MLAAIALAAMVPHGNHAVLISYATEADSSPVADCQLMSETLVGAGWGRNEIHYYDGNRENGSLAFLAKEVEEAKDGHLLVYISGNAKPDTAMLNSGIEPYWQWEKLMVTLSKGGEITLVPDTGYSNLAYGRFARNVRGLIVEATWRDITQRRITTNVLHQGRPMRVGILTYVLAREWPFSTSLADLAYRVNKIKDSGSMAAMWQETPRVRAYGPHTLDPL